MRNHRNVEANMNRWLNSVVLVTSLAIAGSSFAVEPAFDDVDANGDGMLSKVEASVVKGLDFAKADRDKDGMLDRMEYEDATG